jgi:hypothetical protein
VRFKELYENYQSKLAEMQVHIEENPGSTKVKPARLQSAKPKPPSAKPKKTLPRVDPK